MAITPAQYDLLVCPAVLQLPFLDKDTGAPLAGGIVTFYQDAQRSILKNVYYQTGTPGAYTYIPVSNPMTLTAVGTPANPGGNDILLYYYPYDETIAEPTQQLYYVTIYSSVGVLQETREGFPFMPATDDPTTVQQDLLNLIPNPQFAAHDNVPNNTISTSTQDVPNATPLSPTTASTIVAPGGSVGWYYAKPASSTDTDMVSFTQLTAVPQGLSGNPRWAIQVSCSATAAADTFKHLRVRFNNVNRFAGAQNYTLSFGSINNNAGDIPVTFDVLKYFGTGGSGTTVPASKEFTVSSGQWLQQSFVFAFGNNNGQTVGTTNNDDYIEIVFSFPPTSIFSVSLTDFFLTPGALTLNDFPERPDNDVFATGIAGSMPTPDPNGGDLYLPIIYGKGGFQFDDSQVGMPFPNFSSTLPAGYLLADGTAYQNGAYNSVSGIPYSRLFNTYWNGGAYGNIPQFGTGSNFVTGYISSVNTSILTLSQNTYVTAASPADGLVSTTFTFASDATSSNTNRNLLAIRQGQTGLFIKALNTNGGGTYPTYAGIATPASAGTSGFTVSSVVNTPNTRQIVSVTGVTAAGTLTGATGKYFTFQYDPSTTNYYVWYQITTEADPAVGGATGIKVKLNANDTAADVAYKTINAITGGYSNSITTVGGSSVPAGSYFTFTAGSNSYFVWYQVAGAPANAPAVSGTAIKVSLLGTESAAQVATATKIAVNSVFFAVPDLRGLSLRGNDASTPNWDYSALLRSGAFNNAYYGVNPGTLELDAFQEHTHTYGFNTTVGPTSYIVPSGMGPFGTALVAYTGGNETRSVNMSVNWVIKY